MTFPDPPPAPVSYTHLFTTEEAWLERYPHVKADGGSVHLELMPVVPETWRDDALAAKWETIREVRRVVTGALELERAAKRIGSSLEAAPVVHVSDEALRTRLADIDFAEVCITSAIVVTAEPAPENAFRIDDVPGVAVMPAAAAGVKCARSWRYFDPAAADPAYPDVTPRDAQALREWDAREQAA